MREEPRFAKGDRVVVTDYIDGYDGKHGTITTTPKWVTPRKHDTGWWVKVALDTDAEDGIKSWWITVVESALVAEPPGKSRVGGAPADG